MRWQQSVPRQGGVLDPPVCTDSISRMNGRVHRTASPHPTPIQYHPVPSHCHGVSPVPFQGPQEEFEPSCLVRTPSGNVYIPSAADKTSSMDFKQSLHSPVKGDHKALYGFAEPQFGHGIPVIPMRNNLRRAGVSPTPSIGGGVTPRCSWRCTAILFICISVILATLLIYIAASSVLVFKPISDCGVEGDLAIIDDSSDQNQHSSRGNSAIPNRSVVFNPFSVMTSLIGSNPFKPSVQHESQRMRRSVAQHDLELPSMADNLTRSSQITEESVKPHIFATSPTRFIFNMSRKHSQYGLVLNSSITKTHLLKNSEDYQYFNSSKNPVHSQGALEYDSSYAIVNKSRIYRMTDKINAQIYAPVIDIAEYISNDDGVSDNATDVVEPDLDYAYGNTPDSTSHDIMEYDTGNSTSASIETVSLPYNGSLQDTLLSDESYIKDAPVAPSDDPEELNFSENNALLDQMVGDDPSSYDYFSTRPGSKKGRKGFWNLGWVFEETKNESKASSLSKTSVQKGGRKDPHSFYLFEDEDEEWPTLRRKNLAKTSEGSFSMTSDTKYEDFIESENEKFKSKVPYPVKGGKKSIHDDNSASHKTNSRGTFKHFTEKPQPRMPSAMKTITVGLNEEPKLAIDVFPHIFDYDLSPRHEDYYYDDTNGTVYVRKEGVYKKDKNLSQFVNSETGKRLQKHPNTQKVVIPEGLKSMSLIKKKDGDLSPEMLEDDSAFPSSKLTKEISSRVRKDLDRSFQYDVHHLEFIPYDEVIAMSESHPNIIKNPRTLLDSSGLVVPISDAAKTVTASSTEVLTTNNSHSHFSERDGRHLSTNASDTTISPLFNLETSPYVQEDEEEKEEAEDEYFTLSDADTSATTTATFGSESSAKTDTFPVISEHTTEENTEVVTELTNSLFEKSFTQETMGIPEENQTELLSSPYRLSSAEIVPSSVVNHRSHKRVTVNVTIATEDETLPGDNHSKHEKPVYVLSVSVPTSGENKAADISILQPDEVIVSSSLKVLSVSGNLSKESFSEDSERENALFEASSAQQPSFYDGISAEKCYCPPCSQLISEDKKRFHIVNDLLSTSKVNETLGNHIQEIDKYPFPGPYNTVVGEGKVIPASQEGHDFRSTPPTTISAPSLSAELLSALLDYALRPNQTIPPDGTTFQMVELGKLFTSQISPYSYWNMQFYQPESSYVTFEVAIPRGASIVIYGRRNALPTHTHYDFLQVLSGYRVGVGGQGRPTRASKAPTQVQSLTKYLEQGHWFLSVYNDDGDPQAITWTGVVSAEYTEGCPRGCSGHGECILGTCQCHPGFTGPDCTQMKCPVLCSSNGDYRDGECVCNPGWKGKECSIRHDECEIPDCNGHGRCVEGRCVCNKWFKGDSCNEVDCPHPNCNGHGWCVNGTCICQRGWRGPDCAQMDEEALDCLPDCSGHGQFDVVRHKCFCDAEWTGPDCGKKVCDLDCGPNGHCEGEECVCTKGWAGRMCDFRACDSRCEEHGQCRNGSCICMTGWNGRHCTLPGCPQSCSGHGSCIMNEDEWQCQCHNGWDGKDCSMLLEKHCNDLKDNDNDDLVDCADTECCFTPDCQHSPMCISSADPIDILLRKQPPAVTASFFQRMRFIVEEGSVQNYAKVSAFNESRASVVRGRVISGRGSGLIGVRVSYYKPGDMGFTITRMDGWFDLMVNGGGAVKLLFGKSPFLPVIKTVWVPWNEVVVIDTVIMTTSAIVPPPPPAPCTDHDYQVMKPVVLATWKHGFQGSCPDKSGILTESQVVQQSLLISGTGLYLVYHSSRQRVYGVTWAVVKVGYVYNSCGQVIWDTQTTQVSGHDMSISDIGGWDLSIHHHYNFHEGILQKGDGQNIYLKQRPRILKNLLGDGRQREVSCRTCDGHALKQRLLTPSDIAASPDGSIYVADFNLVRRVMPDNAVKTVVKLNETRVSYRYHIAVGPVSGTVYVSDPESHQILKVKDPDSFNDPENNIAPFVGSGERCLPGDEVECGDSGLARDAKLQYPKGMVVSSDEVLYFADGTNVRAVDSDGIISTVIGTHRHRSHWKPLPCSGTLSVSDVKLRWPTSLAISPLDNSLYVLDDHHILKLTRDGRVKVVAGRPLRCPPASIDTPSDLASHTTLRSPQDLAFGPNGNLFIAESDTERINRIRVIETDERIHDFAGADSKCNCHDENCSCYEESHVMAATAVFSTISAIAVTPNGVVHILDQGNLRVRSVTSSIPQPTLQRTYEIYSPETHEIYVFNRFGHHVETRNIPTGKTVYTFFYTVNSSSGKLSYIKDAADNRVSFRREYTGKVTMIETSRRQKCRLTMSRTGYLESFVTPDDSNVSFTYYGSTGLLQSQMDSTGRAHAFVYDKYGRLTRSVTPSGQVIELSFDLSIKGARVTVRKDGTAPVTMSIKGSYVTETIGMASSITAQQLDGTVITKTPWDHFVVTKTVPYALLVDNTLASSFPVPGSQRTEIGDELINSFDWKYFTEAFERNGPIMQVGRKMRVNGEDLLTFKYDISSETEAVFNEIGQTLLNVTYDGLGKPLRWLPTPHFIPVQLSYNRFGELEKWKWGNLKEEYSYDRAGRFQGITYGDDTKLIYSFKDEVTLKPTQLSIGGSENFMMDYDEIGALSAVITPRGHKYLFQLQPSVLHNRFKFTVPGFSRHPYQVFYNDDGKLLAKVLPQQVGRVIYSYDESGRLQYEIFGDGSVRYDYYDDTGLVKAVTLTDKEYKYETLNKYHAGLMREKIIEVGKESAKLKYLYDGNSRQRKIEVEVNGRQVPDYEVKYEMTLGTLDAINDLKITTTYHNRTVIQDARKTMVRVNTFDPHGRLTESTLTIRGRLNYRTRYQYNVIGKLSSLSIWKGPGTTETVTNYTYTSEGYIKAIGGSKYWLFRYDDNGNVIAAVEDDQEVKGMYDAADRLIKLNGEEILYDAAGRAIKYNHTHYSYTARGNLRYVWKNGNYQISLLHDYKGRLVLLENESGEKTHLIYADLKRPQLVTHVYYSQKDLTYTLIYDNLGRLIAVQTETGRLWVATDHLGTPLAVFDSSGVLVKEVLRMPWGVTYYDSRPELNLFVDFQGGIREPKTGLIIFGLNTYDPHLMQWLAPRFDVITSVPDDILSIFVHRYNRNDPANSPSRHGSHYTDLHSWLQLYGVDVAKMLGSYYHDETVDLPSDLEVPHTSPSLCVISGLSCSTRSVMKQFSKLSLMPDSLIWTDKLPWLSPSWAMQEGFSSSGPVLGPGILLSRVNGQALVTLVPSRENSVVQDVARSVLNGSALLDITFTHHHHHTLYFVKEDESIKQDDFQQLHRLSGLFNVTMPKGEHLEIKVTGSSVSLVLLYGTTANEARHRLLKHMHRKASEKAWEDERRFLQNGGPNVNAWSEKEREALLKNGYVSGYTTVPLHSVHTFPLLADDPNNVIFTKENDERKRRSHQDLLT